jgi:diguanylate cyclase (GGDEF)-like protein
VADNTGVTRMAAPALTGAFRGAPLLQRLVLIVGVAVVSSAAFCYSLYLVLGLPIISGGVGGMVAFLAPLVTPAVVAPFVMVPLERSNRRSVTLLDQVERARAELAAEMAERQKVQERLEHEVRHDPLTGVLNRRGFFEVCQARPATTMTLYTVDVDRFKDINDNLGHMAGDAVLCAVAEVLRAAAGADGWVGRIGGDEFVVLHPGAPADSTIGCLLAGWQVDLSDGASCWASASVGSSHLEPGASVDLALSAADRAMFRAKKVRAADREALPGRPSHLAETVAVDADLAV